MSALQWIVKEAKSLKKSYPKRFTKWTDYVKQASAIYASKHGGKSPVGKKKAVKKVAVKKAAKKKIVKKIGGSSDYYTRKKEGRVIPRKSTKKTTKTVFRSPLKKKAVKKPSEQSILNKIHKVKHDVERLDEAQHKHMSGIGAFNKHVFVKLESVSKEIDQKEVVIKRIISNKKIFVERNGLAWYKNFLKMAKSYVSELKKHKTELKKHI
jgi:hypothetical protein